MDSRERADVVFPDRVLQVETAGDLSREALEKIEILEQKLKIARRKDQAEKVIKITKKLEDLRKGDKEQEAYVVHFPLALAQV